MRRDGEAEGDVLLGGRDGSCCEFELVAFVVSTEMQEHSLVHYANLLIYIVIVL